MPRRTDEPPPGESPRGLEDPRTLPMDPTDGPAEFTPIAREPAGATTGPDAGDEPEPPAAGLVDPRSETPGPEAGA